MIEKHQVVQLLALVQLLNPKCISYRKQYEIPILHTILKYHFNIPNLDFSRTKYWYFIPKWYVKTVFKNSM